MALTSIGVAPSMIVPGTAGATRLALTDLRIMIDSRPDLTAVVDGTTTRVPLTVDLGSAPACC